MHIQALRHEVRRMLERGETGDVASLALRERRVLSILVALTYDERVADRAVDAFGPAAGLVSDVDDEFVRGHLRRLLWLMSDESGGICLRGPELLAGALVARPERFAAFRPILESLIDMEPEDAVRFRPSWERAMRRVNAKT